MAYESETSLFGRYGAPTRDYFQMGVSPRVAAGQLSAAEALGRLGSYPVESGGIVRGSQLANLGKMQSGIGSQLASLIADTQSRSERANQDAIKAQDLNRRRGELAFSSALKEKRAAAGAKLLELPPDIINAFSVLEKMSQEGAGMGLAENIEKQVAAIKEKSDARVGSGPGGIIPDAMSDSSRDLPNDSKGIIGDLIARADAKRLAREERMAAPLEAGTHPFSTPTYTDSAPHTLSAEDVGVFRGMTWGDVADHLGVEEWRLRAANPGVNLNDLYPGQALNLGISGNQSIGKGLADLLGNRRW